MVEDPLVLGVMVEMQEMREPTVWLDLVAPLPQQFKVEPARRADQVVGVA